MPIGNVEGRRLDDVDGDAETGGHADHRAGILRDVRLEEGEAEHERVMAACAGIRQGRPAAFASPAGPR